MTAADSNGAASPIVDNTHQRVGDFLRAEMIGGSALSFVSAYFTIYAYEALREALEGASRLRFLYGDPQGVGTVDPSGDEAKAFVLTEAGGLELRRALAQKGLARACAARRWRRTPFPSQCCPRGRWAIWASRKRWCGWRRGWRTSSGGATGRARGRSADPAPVVCGHPGDDGRAPAAAECGGPVGVHRPCRRAGARGRRRTWRLSRRRLPAPLKKIEPHRPERRCGPVTAAGGTPYRPMSGPGR